MKFYGSPEIIKKKFWILMIWIITIMAIFCIIFGYMKSQPVHATCCTTQDQLKKDIQKYYEKHPEEKLR